MTLDGAIERYTSNAEYERTHGSLQGCLEFKQLAEWLKDYKRLKKQETCYDAISRQAVLELAKKGVLISNGNYESVCKAINELPPVNPQERSE